MMATWIQWSQSATTAATDNGTWVAWTSTDATAPGTMEVTGSGVTISGFVWDQWNGTATSACVSDYAWSGWVAAGSMDASIELIVEPPQLSEQERAEQEREREARQSEWEQRRERDRREIEAANEKAEKLLRENLTPEQNKELDDLGYFIVQAAERRYRVRRGRTVGELDEQDQVVASLCAHPYDRVPAADTMLAQKLMLEDDESEFRGIANITQHQYARG